MSDRILVSTRKGLFRATRKNAGWKISDVDFLGDNVTLALRLRLRSTQSRSFRS